MIYAVTLEAAAFELAPAPTDDQIDAFVDAMADYSGVVSAGQDSRRYGATFDIDVDELDHTLAAATSVFRSAATSAGLPAWPIVRAEILTLDEQARDLDSPIGLLER